jgi:cytochrome c
MKKRQFLVGVAALGLMMSLATSPVFADEKEDAKAMVEAAAKAVTANKEDGLKQIQAGKFVKGEVYVFAYNFDAALLAHPNKAASSVGPNSRSLLDEPDAEGKLFRKEIVEKAKSAGTGWVDYVYKNPVTKAVENKTTYLKRAGDVVICAGVYK